MNDERTHGDHSAVDEDLHQPPRRILVGPYQMVRQGHQVVLSFENHQYAEIFERRHECRSINALQPGFRDYADGRERFTVPVIELIELICAEEGAEVTFTGSNPDFNGLPNEAVTVCSSATDWSFQTIRADTIHAALLKAVASPEEPTND